MLSTPQKHRHKDEQQTEHPPATTLAGYGSRISGRLYTPLESLDPFSTTRPNRVAPATK